MIDYTLTMAEKKKLVEAMMLELPLHTQWLRGWEPLEERKVRELASLDPLSEKAEEVKEELRQIRQGVADTEGTYPTTAALQGTHANGRPKYGLIQTRKIIQRLTSEIATYQAYLTRFPSATTTHPYKYTGRRFLAMWEGRYLEPGDVVQLNESQSISMRDRFVAVDESKATEQREVASKTPA